MGDEQFRIPKFAVPIVCYTILGEQMSGEIFVDILLTEGYSPGQILDFLNERSAFFPLRLNRDRSVLVLKESVVQVEVPGLIAQYEEHIQSFVTRKDVVLHLTTGPVRATLVLDLPQEHSRILDLVNTGKDFFPALVGENLSFINIHHTCKIEEM
jgi:hypothetical protein